MSRISKRKPIKTNDSLSYSDLEQYGLGSWLKENASWVAPIAGVGAGLLTAGLAAGPVTAGLALAGAGAGASLGSSVGGAVTNNYNQQKQQEVQFKDMTQNNAKTKAQNQFQVLQGTNPEQTYRPVAKCGGKLRRYANGGPLTIDKVTGNARATADSVKTYQGILTGALADKTRGMLNVDSILTANTSRPDFNRLKIPEYAQQIIDTSGDYALTPEEQRATLGTDYDKYVKAVRNYRTNVGNYSNAVNTKGTFELNPDVSQENFGYRNMLERMPWSKEEGTPYAYLKNKLPKKAMGGTLNYGGQLHEGPDGGNPVDGKGNVNLDNPTALVQKGEVGYNTEDGSTYIFSDDLFLDKGKTFAREAKQIQSKYKKRLGKNMIEKHDALASKGYNRDMNDLLDKQEQVREANGIVDNMEKLFGGAVGENQLAEQMKNGGTIHIKPENKGKFNALKKRTGKTNEELTHSKNPLTRKRAIFAQNAKKWKHEMGGELPVYEDGSLLPINPNLNYQIPNPMQLPTASQIRTDLRPSISTTSTEGQWKPDTGMEWQSAVSLAAPIAGAITNRLTRKKPRKIQLDESGATPVGINLERERAADREQANLSRANIKRALKSGTSAQQYMANIAAAETGVQRGLGQQLGESYQKEEMYNSGLSQQEAARADQLKQMQLQADMYNSQLDAQTNAQNQADITGIINALNVYGRDVLQSKRDMNYLQMMDPRYQFLARRRKWYSPKENKLSIIPENVIKNG